MAIQPICMYPSDILREKLKPVRKITEFHRKVICDLIDTLRAQPGGVGIAAPQIGYPERIAVVDISLKEAGKKMKILINPEIVWADEYKIGREGCMSIPHFTANVKRAHHVRIKWWDENFTEHETKASGLEAICFQHEVDHLNGFLFLDRVASLARDVFRRKRYL